VIDILSSDSDEEDEAVSVGADVSEKESPEEEVQDETAILNAIVDDYINAEPNEQPQVEEDTAIDEAKVLHENIKEYIAVSSPFKKSPEKSAEEAVNTVEGKLPADDDFPHPANDTMVHVQDESFLECEEMGAEKVHISTDAGQPGVTDVEPLVVDAEHQEAVHGEGGIEGETTQESKAADSEACLKKVETTPTGEEAKAVMGKPTEDEAEKSDNPYSSDGGNLGGEFSEDMNADDEHESLDTEDDKRSLAEQGETFDEEEGASEIIVAVIACCCENPPNLTLFSFFPLSS
jgi:hypothetical protein